mgnify:FL=1
MTDGPLRPIWPVGEVKKSLAAVDRNAAKHRDDMDMSNAAVDPDSPYYLAWATLADLPHESESL